MLLMVNQYKRKDSVADTEYLLKTVGYTVELTAVIRSRYQGFHFRKLEMSRKPSVWLFSGWNWVPAMLSIPTIAVTGPPYWASATRARRSATSTWKECTK